MNPIRATDPRATRQCAVWQVETAALVATRAVVCIAPHARSLPVGNDERE